MTRHDTRELVFTCRRAMTEAPLRCSAIRAQLFQPQHRHGGERGEGKGKTLDAIPPSSSPSPSRTGHFSRNEPVVEFARSSLEPLTRGAVDVTLPSSRIVWPVSPAAGAGSPCAEPGSFVRLQIWWKVIGDEGAGCGDTSHTLTLTQSPEHMSI